MESSCAVPAASNVVLLVKTRDYVLMMECSDNKNSSSGNHLPEACPSVRALEHELAFLVRRLEAARRRFHFGLERAHYLLLILLERNDRQSVGELASQVNLDASTVTRQVAAMKKAGLVEKHDNPEDRRGGFITITRLGRDTAAEVRARRLRRIEGGFREWSEEERREFARLTARYNDNLRDLLNGEDEDSG